MRQFRTYGSGQVRVVVIHGGPGAPGEVGQVCHELSSDYGVLEPFQTAVSVEGQIEELADILSSETEPPVILIGHSWGAWLGAMVTARYPALIRKLILVSSGVFEEEYATIGWQTRMSRLTTGEQERVKTLLDQMNDPGIHQKEDLLAEFGKIMGETDSYHETPDSGSEEPIPCNHALFARVWDEAAVMRKNGKLLDVMRQISCQVTVIHGDYDPYPAAGVKEPLSRLLPDFSFILLERCGHTPWREMYARDTFYSLIRREITAGWEGEPDI